MHRIEQAMMGGLTRFVSRCYLRKPDIAELLYIKFPTFKSALVAALNELFFLLRLSRGFRVTSVNLESTNHCNLRCKMCPVNKGMKREKGYMDIDLFKRVIDDNPQLEFILPFHWGEPLLHPRIVEMINYAHERGIRTMMTTNGALMSDEIMEKILRSGLNRLTFSMDGIGDTYSRIRGYDYDKLKATILRFRRKRDEINKDLKIDLSLVVFQDTEEEVEGYRRGWTGVVDRVQVIPRLLHSAERRLPCRELWRGAAVIFWDGTVVPCCADYEGTLELGNVKEKSLPEIWNGPKMRQLRRSHRQRRFVGACRSCGEYASSKVSPRFS